MRGAAAGRRDTVRCREERHSRMDRNSPPTSDSPPHAASRHHFSYGSFRQRRKCTSLLPHPQASSEMRFLHYLEYCIRLLSGQTCVNRKPLQHARIPTTDRPPCFDPRLRVGGDDDWADLTDDNVLFRSTPPCGRRPLRLAVLPRHQHVSIHASVTDGAPPQPKGDGSIRRS